MCDMIDCLSFDGGQPSDSSPVDTGFPVRCSERDFDSAAEMLTPDASSLYRCFGMYYSFVIAFVWDYYSTDFSDCQD